MSWWGRPNPIGAAHTASRSTKQLQWALWISESQVLSSSLMDDHSQVRPGSNCKIPGDHNNLSLYRFSVHTRLSMVVPGYLSLLLSCVYFWNTVEVFLNLKCFVAISAKRNSENSYIDCPGKHVSENGCNKNEKP